jgi:hypothetical protein
MHRPAGRDQPSSAPARATRQACPWPRRNALSYLTLWAQRSRAPTTPPGDARSRGADGLRPGGRCLGLSIYRAAAVTYLDIYCSLARGFWLANRPLRPQPTRGRARLRNVSAAGVPPRWRTRRSPTRRGSPRACASGTSSTDQSVRRGYIRRWCWFVVRLDERARERHGLPWLVAGHPAGGQDASRPAVARPAS